MCITGGGGAGGGTPKIPPPPLDPPLNHVGNTLPGFVYSGRLTVHRTREITMTNASTVNMENNEAVSYKTLSSSTANKTTNNCIIPIRKKEETQGKMDKNLFESKRLVDL